jgi:hypothetical protein
MLLLLLVDCPRRPGIKPRSVDPAKDAEEKVVDLRQLVREAAPHMRVELVEAQSFSPVSA